MGVCLGMTTPTSTTTGTSWDAWSRSNSRGMPRYLPGSKEKYELFGRKKMKKASRSANPRATTKGQPSTKARLMTGSAESFFSRSRDRAGRLDRREKLPAHITVVFEDPADLLRVLSAERVRVLRGVRGEPKAVSKLASDLGRDRQAVRRDVSLLESLGLLRTREESNPGHGRKRIVEALAEEYQLVATI